MELLLKATVLYFSVSILIIANCWYMASIIKTRWPAWWKRVIVDVEPDSSQTWKHTRYQ